MTRHPEAVAKHTEVALALWRESLPHIEALYAQERKANDPPTYEEFALRHGPNPKLRTIVRVIQSLIDNADLGQNLNSMRWMVLSNRKPKFELLTSDRPLLLTNGIGKPEGHVILPMSPFHAFVATNNVETEEQIRGLWKAGTAFAQINERVACQSRKYVWGSDDSQLRFVSKRLGRKYTADPTENLSAESMIAAARAAARNTP